MPRSFTNMDSLWLVALADSFSPNLEDEAPIHARLLAIAENIQGLDEKNQNLINATDGYAQGYAAAEAAMRRRSNILSNPEGEDATGKAILDQINRRVAENNVKRIPLGERALDDKPHEFNGPRKRAAPVSKPLPKVDLDLDFLEDL